jgi:hypothetical protein
MHVLPDTWQFNGDLERPTFSPSFRHSAPDPDHPGTNVSVCHYILTAGILHFCSDSMHKLAGQQVPLPDLPERLRDPCAFSDG